MGFQLSDAAVEFVRSRAGRDQSRMLRCARRPLRPIRNQETAKAGSTEPVDFLPMAHTITQLPRSVKAILTRRRTRTVPLF